MNEIDIIRTQLAAERRHAAEVANACATAHQTAVSTGPSAVGEAALSEFRQACVEYLVWILTRYEERDQMLAEVFNSRQAPDNAVNDASLRTLNELLARSGRSREALLKLEDALRGSDSSQATQHDLQAQRWHEFIQFFNGAWAPRRDALDKLFERQSRVTDWRVVSGIDADSMLDERQRYGRVKAKVAPGLTL